MQNVLDTHRQGIGGRQARLLNLSVCIGIFIFATMLYANTFGHGWVLDDSFLFKDNKYVYTHEPERDLLRYIDLVAVSADYWVKNPEMRFRTNEFEVTGQKINRSCVFEGTLFIRPDGQIRYKDPKGVHTDWEIDPAVNPNGIPTVSKSLPIKPVKKSE